MKILINRLTFFLFELNLRIIGRYKPDQSSVGNSQRAYYSFSSILQTIGVVSFNLFVYAQQLNKYFNIRISSDIVIVSALLSSFLIVYFFDLKDKYFEHVYIPLGRSVSYKKRLIYHLATLILFFALPVIVLVYG